jgi:hypothetical protein
VPGRRGPSSSTRQAGREPSPGPAARRRSAHHGRTTSCAASTS